MILITTQLNARRQSHITFTLGPLGNTAGRNADCLAARDEMLTYLDDNADVWLGWTYWAAGPWWGDYIFTVEPLNGADRPPTAVLQGHLQP